MYKTTKVENLEKQKDFLQAMAELTQSDREMYLHYIQNEAFWQLTDMEYLYLRNIQHPIETLN